MPICPATMSTADLDDALTKTRICMIALLIKTGTPVPAAVDKVLGKGAYQNIENRLYAEFARTYGADTL